MRALRTLAATACIVGLALLPAAGALLHLGLALEAMGRRAQAEEEQVEIGLAGKYVVDPRSSEDGLKLDPRARLSGRATPRRLR